MPELIQFRSCLWQGYGGVVAMHRSQGTASSRVIHPPSGDR
jgi:hypothetical protein